MSIKVIVFCIATVLLVQLPAQPCHITLKGQILDESTQAPLEFATAYVVETNLGASSDEKGYFQINGICPGKYHLQISHIGCCLLYTSRKDVANINYNELGADGILIKTIGRNLCITGGDRKGVLYAMYTLSLSLIHISMYSGLYPCRANGAGLVGMGCVGQGFSPGMVLIVSTGTSSIGNKGVPFSLSNKNT